MSRSALRFVTFLAPNMYPLYEATVRYLSTRLRRPAELVVGRSYDDLLLDGDAGFLCGLAYVKLKCQQPGELDPLVAPQLSGDRYGGRPIYFSDVIVRRDSPWHTLNDLRGRSWAYNERDSHSGFGVVRHELRRLGHSWRFFGRVVRTGWHERSIRLVREGAVDASAIDSQVLAVAQREEPKLADEVRVLISFGPSTIQPLVAGRRLPSELRAEMRAHLLEMHADPTAGQALAHGFVERFVEVSDRSYDDIRIMWHGGEPVPQSSSKRKRKIPSTSR